MRKIPVLIVLGMLCVPTLAAAQGVQRPTRPVRGLFGGGPPPDPNRTRQELTLTGSMLGGYEDFIVPGGVGAPATPGVAYSGNADASLRYWRGRAVRSLAANVRIFSSTYSLGNLNPTLGANVDLAGSTQAGRKNTIGFTQAVSYEPSLAFGAYQSLAQTVAPSQLPEAGVGSAFLDQQSWSSSSAVNLQRRWTTRQTTTGTATYLSRRYLNDLGYDSDTRGANARYSWNITRSTALESTYRYSQSQVEDPDGAAVPVADQTVEAGVSYSRRLSPTRQIHFSGGTGATYVQTQDPVTRANLRYWTPSGQAMVRMDLGRSWAVGIDYRRAISVLPGITLQSFGTDAASLRASGGFGRRLEAVLSAAFSNGRAGYGENPARYESYSGSAQLHFALSRCCATSLNYEYYYYNLHAVTNVPTGLPNQYDRNSVRLGISVWLPLFGEFGRTGAPGR